MTNGKELNKVLDDVIKDLSKVVDVSKMIPAEEAPAPIGGNATAPAGNATAPAKASNATAATTAPSVAANNSTSATKAATNATVPATPAAATKK